jgi:peptidyl-tRNA hydrolase, PTH1 family
LRVIFGIGNPGKKYLNTKHNIGFSILDHIAEKYSLQFKPSKKDYYITGSKINASQFFLIKPTTFVNLSGIAANQVFEDIELVIEDFLVLVDDVNLDVGKLRIRNSGGDGGHNGLYSINYQLQNDNYPRLRFGIGKDFEHGEMADYVLSGFDKSALPDLQKAIECSGELVASFITGGTKAMLENFSQLNNKLKSNKIDDHLGE